MTHLRKDSASYIWQMELSVSSGRALKSCFHTIWLVKSSHVHARVHFLLLLCWYTRANKVCCHSSLHHSHPFIQGQHFWFCWFKSPENTFSESAPWSPTWTQNSDKAEGALVISHRRFLCLCFCPFHWFEVDGTGLEKCDVTYVCPPITL